MLGTNTREHAVGCQRYRLCGGEMHVFENLINVLGNEMNRKMRHSVAAQSAQRTVARQRSACAPSTSPHSACRIRCCTIRTDAFGTTSALWRQMCTPWLIDVEAGTKQSLDARCDVREADRRSESEAIEGARLAMR